MKVIYHCYGSAHSSIVSAAIHLGHLPSDRIPEEKEIIALQDFDVARNDSLGHLFFKGNDAWGNEVYTIGMGPESPIVKRTLCFMIEQSHMDAKEFYFAEALPNINRLAKIGGALSRRYGWVKVGRYLAAKGICQSYEGLIRFVHQTRKEIIKDKEVE
jgi:hypothetical protein